LVYLAYVGTGGGRGLHGIADAELRQLFRCGRPVPGEQHEHQPEPECHAQQKEHRRDLASSVNPRAAAALGFHPTIVDRSQLIEAGLTRRQIVKKIDWFDARIVAPVSLFCASTNSKP